DRSWVGEGSAEVCSPDLAGRGGGAAGGGRRPGAGTGRPAVPPVGGPAGRLPVRAVHEVSGRPGGAGPGDPRPDRQGQGWQGEGEIGRAAWRGRVEKSGGD